MRLKLSLLIVSISAIGVFLYIFQKKLFPENPHPISIGKIDESATKKIRVDISAASDYTYSSLVDSTKFLVLEDNEHSHILSIGDIVFHKDKIIVWDEEGQKIVGFDRNGEYLFNLYRKGNSKEEYKNLSEFTFDYNQELIVIKSWYKILWYDLKGNFVKSQKIKYVKNIAILEDSRLIMFSNYGSTLNTKPKTNIHILGKNGKPIIGYSQLVSEVSASNILHLNNHFSRYDPHLLLTNPYTQNVLSISKKGVFKRYNIDFGINNLPKNYANTVLTNPNLDWGKVRSFERLNNWARLTSSIRENKHWLHFSVISGKVSKQFFFNKHTEKFLHYEFGEFDNVGKEYPNIFALDGEWLVSMTTSRNTKRDLLPQRSNKKEIDVSKNENLNDNPVLQFTRLKTLKY